MREFLITILAATLIVSCVWTPIPSSSAETVHVIHDRSDAKLEWVFVIRRQEVIAQRHIFPGHTKPTIFRLQITSPDRRLEIDNLVSIKGDISPPFVPGGPWYIRMDIRLDQNKRCSREYFENNNTEVAKTMRQLRDDVMKLGQPTNVLPAWIRGSARILAALGRG